MNGYFHSFVQGDAEATKFTDVDSDISQAAHPSMPTLRTYVVHEGICRVVTDILIDLSKRCLSNRNFRICNLIQIATRLYTIRDLLGGSMYLIRGFASILDKTETHLRDFQKAILDLVGDLNTPEILSAYFSLMTSENPPLDLLLNRLVSLGSSAQSNQPSTEIDFPILCGKPITSR